METPSAASLRAAAYYTPSPWVSVQPASQASCDIQLQSAHESSADKCNSHAVNLLFHQTSTTSSVHARSSWLVVSTLLAVLIMMRC